MSLYDRQRSSVVTLKGQGAPDHISRTPGQEVAQIEAELRSLGVRKGHKCPFCRLPVPDKLRWKTQGGGKDCPLMYRGNCPNAKPRVNALGRRMRTLREAAEAEAVADDLVSAYQGVAREVQDEAEIVWSAPADAEDDDEPAARKKRCACVKDDGTRCRELVLGADEWDASMGDWDPERYCSQECARAEERRAARILAERAPAPAPSTKPKRPLQRSHDGGLAGMIAACAKPPEEAAAEETSSSEEEEEEDESSVEDDEAPPAPAPGRVVGTVRKWDGRRGFIRLEGQASDAVLFEDNVRGGATLRVGDRVEFALKSGKKHPSAVDVAPLIAAAPAPTAAPAAGRAVGVVRKFDGASGWITLKTGKTGGKHRVEAILRLRNIRPGETLAVGDWVDFVAEDPPRNVPNGAFTARDVARRCEPAPRPAPAAAAAPSSGDAFVDALHAWIRAQGKTSVEGGALSLFWEAHPSVPRPKRTAAHIKAHGGGLLRFVEDQGGHNHIEIVGEGAAPAPARAPRAPPGSRAAGTVAWWKGPRGAGHGFIIRKTGQEDLFVHESGLGAGLAGLRTGDRVTFRVGRAPNGRDTALDVARTAAAPAAVAAAVAARPNPTARAAEPATGATHASHRATQHEVEAAAARVAAGLFAADGPLPINQFAARFKRRLRENERRLDADSQQRAWAYAESTLVTLDRARRVVGVRDDAGAAAEARARQRGRERRAYYGTGGGPSEDQLLQRALEASRAENYAPHRQPQNPLDADAALLQALEASRQSYEREQRAQPAYAQPTYVPPPKAEQVPPTYSSSFFSAPPPPPPPPAPPVHSGGSSTAEFEARVVAAGLARILPDLKKEEICDLDTLSSLQEDDLKELGLAVGARVKLMRLIKSVQAEG